MLVAEMMARHDAELRALIEDLHTVPAPKTGLGRRTFFKLMAGAGSGLVLGFSLKAGDAMAADGGGEFAATGADTLNAFIRIAPNVIPLSTASVITVVSKGPEIGQGIKTAFGLIIAEDLDANWDHVTVDQAPINAKIYGYQGAGGSTSIPRAWDQLRQAGAAARAMLIAAGAREWNVPLSECTAANSMIIHTPTGRTLTYSAMSNLAATMPVPDAASLPLKKLADYKILGKRYTGVDNEKIVMGKPLFGIDVQLPGMLYANYTKCPAVGGKVKSFNVDEIKKLPGVVDAFALDGNNIPAQLMPGVAIVAKSTWEAFKAKAALKVEWDESAASKDSSTAATAKAKELAANPPAPVLDTGNVDTAFAAAGKVVEASYDYAMVSHQQLEPQVTTAWWHDGVMEMWTPSQMAGPGLTQVATLIGQPEEKVVVHQTRAGGGFGRRLTNDYMCEAAAIAQKLKAPVKLQWKREDDFAHDYFRVGGFHTMKAATDKTGKLSAFQHHLVSFTANGTAAVSGGPRSANAFPNDMAPNVRYATSLMPLQVPCGAWRAPTDNTQMFVIGSFLHELSLAAGRDHVEFLLEWFNRPLLPPVVAAGAPPPDPTRLFHPDRAAAVLKLAAKNCGWGKKLPKGAGLGIAFSCAYGGHIAEAVELSVDAKKKITVHKITVVADVGPVINVSSAENQCQGGAIDALSTAMGLEISYENGRIKQANFNDYPILRMRSAPPIDVAFIQPDVRPSGLGEPCLPPLAAALGNALFMATGERVRSMPFKRAGYSI